MVHINRHQVLLKSRSMMLSRSFLALSRLDLQHRSLCSPNHGLSVHHHARSITASNITQLWRSESISQYGQLWPPSLHWDSVDVHLWTILMTALECISMFTRSHPHSAQATMFNDILTVCMMMATKWISQLAWSRLSNAPSNLLNHNLQGHCSVHMITGWCNVSSSIIFKVLHTQE